MNRLLISSLAAISLHGLLFLGIFTDPVTKVPRPLSFQKIKISLSTPNPPASQKNKVSPTDVKNEKQIRFPIKKENTIAPLKPPQLTPIQKEIPALRPIQQKKLIENILHETSPDSYADQVIQTKIKKTIQENVSATNEMPSEEIQKTQEQNMPAASIVIQEAIPLHHTNAPPPYPRAARRRGMEGLVEINALVDKQGKVKEQQIYQSSGHTILDKAALKAVRKWRFDPGVKNGKICEMWVKVPVRFQLITK